MISATFFSLSLFSFMCWVDNTSHFITSSWPLLKLIDLFTQLNDISCKFEWNHALFHHSLTVDRCLSHEKRSSEQEKEQRTLKVLVWVACWCSSSVTSISCKILCHWDSGRVSDPMKRDTLTRDTRITIHVSDGRDESSEQADRLRGGCKIIVTQVYLVT